MATLARAGLTPVPVQEAEPNGLGDVPGAPVRSARSRWKRRGPAVTRWPVSSKRQMANEPTLLPQLKGDKPAGARHGPTAGPAGRRPALPAIGKADRPPGEEAAAPEEAGAGGGGEAGKSDAGSARSAQQQPASREAGSRNPPGRFSAAAAAAAAPSSGARRQAALASLYANAHTYNRALVPPHKWRVLSLAERAKYLAYAPPDPQIKGRAEEAARRATAATRVCRERWLAQHPDFCWPSAAAAPVQEPPSGAEANPWTGQAKRRL
ncbi:MAG: hypothetical protein BJ554DRAFT_5377, partial [Olpidium bornovanus]